MPKSDIEIARAANMKPIKEILEVLNVPDDPKAFSPMGRHIAKLIWNILINLKNKNDGKLILVTAINTYSSWRRKNNNFSRIKRWTQ